MTELTQQEKNQKLWDAACIDDRAGIESALTAGAKINARGPGHFTALHYAASRGYGNLCLFLFEKGAEIDARDIKNLTPLMYAAAGGYSDASLKLIEKNANIHTRGEAGLTVFIYAAFSGLYSVCQKLLEMNADLHAVSDSGTTALVEAATEGHVDICRLLIEHGALNALNNYGQNALVWAARRGRSEAGKLLMRAGARHEISQNSTEQEDHNADTWLAEMAASAREVFSEKSALTEINCLHDNGKPTDAILDACASGQFGALVAVPLIMSGMPEDRTLFDRIWEAIPPRWQYEYSTLQVQLAKWDRPKPVVGLHTQREQVVQGIAGGMPWPG